MGITFGSAIPLICGAHVGTCITALISSLGAYNNGKRTAFMNLYYNLLKTLPFLAVFYLLNTVFHFGFLEKSVGAVGIPMMHTLINLIGAAIWLPAAKVIVTMAQKTIPLSKEELEEKGNTLTILDPILLSKPSFALDQTEHAVNLLAETVSEAFYTLTRVREDPGNEDAVRLLVNANTAFGRVGAITLQILDERKKVYASGIEFPESFMQEVYVFGEAIIEIVEMTAMGLKLKERTLYSTIQLYREEITRLGTLVNLRHIQKMHTADEDHSLSALISRLFYAEERLIDCCDIAADALSKYALAAGRGKEAVPADMEARQKHIRRLFRDKYEMLGLDAE